MNHLYLTVIHKSFRRTIREKATMIGTGAFYFIILFIFSRIWFTSEAKDPKFIFNSVDMVWYLAITEWIMISLPMIHQDVARDVQDGSFSYLNLRPVEYIWIKAVEGLGNLFGRLIFLGGLGFGTALFLTQSLPSHPWMLLATLPLGILGAIVGYLFLFAIGLTSFWLADPTPLSWLWQKAIFILGGLIFPLTIYPDWLASISRYSPFASILYGPAHVIFSPNLNESIFFSTSLLIWGAVAFFLVHFINRVGLAKIGTQGD